MIKIFLADDHKMFRESLCMLLSRENDIQVVGQAEDGIEVETAITESDTDVVLLDISMPRKSGLEVISDVLAKKKDIKIIFLTMHKNEEMINEAFSKGAKGFVIKENAFEELVAAIRRVAAGGRYISPELSPMLLDGFLESRRNGSQLSSREMQVLKLLAEGYNNKDISDMLSISIKTVETHRANIMHKHNFRNITELVLYAVRNHIIEV